MKQTVTEGKLLSLHDWLQVVLSDEYERVSPYVHFPTEEMFDEYLAKIDSINEEDVRLLLSRFLFPSLNTGADKISAQFHSQLSNEITEDEIELLTSNHKKFQKTAYYRRLMNYTKKETFVWEGITWIQDLLPESPIYAVQALDCYLRANIGFMPDVLIHAVSDATILIRAKYINYKQPIELFLGLPPVDFEILVAALYKNMSYEVEITKRSHDGGIDVIARKKNTGSFDNLFIQCKRYKNNLGVKHVDEVLGMLTRNKAPKGILITASDFSIYAKKRAIENLRIELINGKELSILLNNHFGPYWPSKINKIINTFKNENLA